MLVKLAFGNIRRNFKNYWAFFLSAAFSVFVLYLFLSIVFGKATASVASFQSTKVLFGIGAVLTAMFIVFFIWYSNSFFVKSRKKEFATYMLLGMSKNQTVRLSFLENFSILALAYAAGIAAGMLLNKFLIMLLFHLMREHAYVPFEINLQALKICSLIYAGVFVLIAVHSALLLSRNSLIGLIDASRKAERGMKVSWLTYVIGAGAVGFLGLGYFLALVFGTNAILWPLIVLFVCIGTALLFMGIASLYFHFMRRNKTKLYRGTRLVTVAQLMHRFRGNVGALSVIAITTSVALCAVLTCCGMFTNVAESARAMRPFSVEYKNIGNDADAVFGEAGRAHPEIRVKSKTVVDLLQVKTGGNDASEGEDGYVIGESAYDSIIAAQGAPVRARISGAGGCVLVQYRAALASNQPAQTEWTVLAGGAAETLEVERTESGIITSLDRYRRTFVVKDGVYDELRNTPGVSVLSLTEVQLASDALSAAFIADLRARMPAENRMLTYYESYMDGLKMMGVLMFVGVFIGLLFIAATGSILYFRMAMEASEDRDKFITLIKIGMSARELRSAIAKELAVVFAAPLAVAAVNAFMAMFPLEQIARLQMTGMYFIILACYAALYGLYYLLTVNKYAGTIGVKGIYFHSSI